MIMGLALGQALWGQKWQLGTNAVGWAAFGTMNIQMEYALGKSWTLGLQGKYNPFEYKKSDESQMQFKQRSAAAYARWWPWHVYSGWWLCPRIMWQEYNTGGILDQKTEQGQRVGAGISAGYTYMLAKHWNIEFGLGLWGGAKFYTLYSCPRCGDILSSGVGSFILPNDFVVGVSYVF